MRQMMIFYKFKFRWIMTIHRLHNIPRIMLCHKFQCFLKMLLSLIRIHQAFWENWNNLRKELNNNFIWKLRWNRLIILLMGIVISFLIEMSSITAQYYLIKIKLRSREMFRESCRRVEWQWPWANSMWWNHHWAPQATQSI